MWPHSFDLENVIYQLDYGVGSKVQNVEQFRTVFRGSEDSFLISGLMPRYLDFKINNIKLKELNIV